MLRRVDLNRAAVVQLQCYVALSDALDRAQLAIRKLVLGGRRGQLHPVAKRERPLLLSVQRHTPLPARVEARGLAEFT